MNTSKLQNRTERTATHERELQIADLVHKAVETLDQIDRGLDSDDLNDSESNVLAGIVNQLKAFETHMRTWTNSPERSELEKSDEAKESLYNSAKELRKAGVSKEEAFNRLAYVPLNKRISDDDFRNIVHHAYAWLP